MASTRTAPGNLWAYRRQGRVTAEGAQSTAGRSRSRPSPVPEPSAALLFGRRKLIRRRRHAAPTACVATRFQRVASPKDTFITSPWRSTDPRGLRRISARRSGTLPVARACRTRRRGTSFQDDAPKHPLRAVDCWSSGLLGSGTRRARRNAGIARARAPHHGRVANHRPRRPQPGSPRSRPNGAATPASSPNRNRSTPTRIRPLPIGHGQTISQPYIVASHDRACRREEAGDTVLEVGTGSGYQAAMLAQLGVRVLLDRDHRATRQTGEGGPGGHRLRGPRRGPYGGRLRGLARARTHSTPSSSPQPHPRFRSR